MNKLLDDLITKLVKRSKLYPHTEKISITSPLFEWPSARREGINAGEDVEERGPLGTVGACELVQSPGKRHGGASKNETRSYLVTQRLHFRVSLQRKQHQLEKRHTALFTVAQKCNRPHGPGGWEAATEAPGRSSEFPWQLGPRSVLCSVVRDGRPGTTRGGLPRRTWRVSLDTCFLALV